MPPTDKPASARGARADASRNRKAIVAAAAGVAQPGAVNMQAVAAAAGVSRSTLYRNFPTRAALEAALKDHARAAVRSAVNRAAASERPPLAALRELVFELVTLGARHAYASALLPQQVEDAAGPLTPLVERLGRAADLAPRPPAAWLRCAESDFLERCLGAGAATGTRAANAEAERVFRLLVEPLDQGLVVVDAAGALLCLNARAAELVDPEGNTRPGDRLAEPRAETVYEDGSPSPANTYPLAAAVRTHEPQHGIRGHRLDERELRWVDVDARPLQRSSVTYGVVAVLTDVTAEKQWQLERLRPPGELGLPLDITRTLDAIPPHLFPEQFVAEARRISGAPVALYVLDIDGTHLLRLAGPEEFPAHIDAPLALGPELAKDGARELSERVEAELPGVTMAPMWLRGRAIGVLLARGGDQRRLVELGRHGAAAMELVNGYTDVIEAARRRKETHAAAELQQSMVPPRIAHIGGGVLAGSVLPSYEVGGDWFDYVENRDGAWIAIADAAGKGATAGALGGIALAALRAARRSGKSLEETALAMHEVIYDVSRPEFFATAIVARWNAVYSVFSWINCGHPPPVVARPDGTVEQLKREPALPLGLFDRQRKLVRHQRRLVQGELLILHSDGITARVTEDGLFGLDGIERAIARAPTRSAPAVAKEIQEAVMRASEDPLQDDAVAIVFAPGSVNA